ncbi:MAG: hypothetical protein H7343_03485 [Undibacterium sp.]|nr:hypothetical protein [Opitutaceae bacterium]
MKFIFLSGGFAGFIIAAATGWSSDHSPQRTLLDAAVGCLVGALLFRWFWTVLVGGIRETILLRHAAAAALAAAPKQK